LVCARTQAGTGTGRSVRWGAWQPRQPRLSSSSSSSRSSRCRRSSRSTYIAGHLHAALALVAHDARHRLSPCTVHRLGVLRSELDLWSHAAALSEPDRHTAHAHPHRRVCACRRAVAPEGAHHVHQRLGARGCAHRLVVRAGARVAQSTLRWRLFIVREVHATVAPAHVYSAAHAERSALAVVTPQVRPCYALLRFSPPTSPPPPETQEDTRVPRGSCSAQPIPYGPHHAFWGGREAR
jgi:hypothetical protein